jgi:maltose alpha-D-glucosyltransferase/alpha-amylase
LARLARAWNTEVRAAFLEAYDAEAKRHALYAELVPGRGLLGLFELEKALYELHYELTNRPLWAGIPLQGILEWSGT